MSSPSPWWWRLRRCPGILREELFSFDDASQLRGRLMPRHHVGRIRISVRVGTERGVVTLSVQPRKLDEDSEYRQMLDDIAEIATEAILHGFAPAATALEHDVITRPSPSTSSLGFSTLD